MIRKLSIATIAIIMVLVVSGTSYIYKAPYAGNAGLSRMPGVRIGGTLTAAPEDFSSFNDVGTNLIMKLDGFPPFVVYLAYIGTPEGVITGTRPDGGYWPQRVREGRNEGWLRIGDETFAMQATEILGDDRLPMLELWSPRAAESRRAIAQAAGESAPVRDRSLNGSEPQLLPEIFLWTPR
ncbi:hypothetical protein OAL54_06930 [Gammaproteobacteria bacterium]|nr:hypothetical protein [Gammaproteobacteria bacterium]